MFVHRLRRVDAGNAQDMHNHELVDICEETPASRFSHTECAG
jgi:hypothetical protein